MSLTPAFRLMTAAALCCLLSSATANGQSPFVRGDVNCNGVIDTADVNAITNFLFGGFVLPCDDAADVNDDGALNLNDVTSLTNFIVTGVPAPAPPYPLCGFDPTPDPLTCVSSCCGTTRDHFQNWRLQPQTFVTHVTIQDQFMFDGQVTLLGIDYLSNPAQKDSFFIRRPDDHLTWYRADGRDTLLTVEFYNQFGQDTVEIDSLSFLLVPTRKLPHPFPSPMLDHYKAYHIRNPQSFIRPTQISDQFLTALFTADQLTPRYFLTPASKNGEVVTDTVTHYVAYDIFPKVNMPLSRQTEDQFGPHSLQVFNNDMLLVPTYKLSFHPPAQNDTLKNHYKSWRINPPPPMPTITAQVEDQFMSDQLQLNGIEFLSNPAHKDTSAIKRPNDHLNWYRATGNIYTRLQVVFDNQFQRDTIIIDSVSHLLVPCRKDPHPAPDSLLGHYKSYKIKNGTTYRRAVPVQIQDQFDPAGTFEVLDSLVPVYFLTPAIKNGEPAFGSDTHYVAYEIFPKTFMPPPVPFRLTEDQFGLWQLPIGNSELLLVPSRKISWGPPQADTLKNHFKSWRVNPPAPFSGLAVVEDQFGTDQLFLSDIEFLSNPAKKDTSDIRRPDDHLNWYRATGQHPTLLRVEYQNQFNRDTVTIGNVTHLLVPCRKDPHPAPDSLLGHYTAYGITDGKTYMRAGSPVTIQDQFDIGGPEFIDSLVPRYFLTPAIKNSEPAYGSDTHYVAYEIYPKTSFPTGIARITGDQFGLHQLPIFNSELLLVPSNKISWGPPPVDTVKNHYKGWRLDPLPVNLSAQVVDQFMTDVVRLDSIEYLANPAQKNNEPIVLPDDHLLWYSADGRDTCVQVVFNNQFGLDTFVVGTTSYLILPAQKLPHPPPSTMLDHYKAYLVWKPQSFPRVVTLFDQFDAFGPHTVNTLTPLYLCTPVSKNNEPIFDSVTHYVVYKFEPSQSGIHSRTTIDQFGIHDIRTLRSELLMVPSRKLEVKPYCPLTIPGNVNCDLFVTSADVIHLVNYVLKSGIPPCPCPAAGDIDCNGVTNTADIIKLVNFVFKSGLPPCNPCTVIPSLWRCPC